MLMVKRQRKRKKSVTTADIPVSVIHKQEQSNSNILSFLFLISCVDMNVGTTVAVLFYVYINKLVALKKKKSESCFFLVYCYIHNKLAGSYCP